MSARTSLTRQHVPVCQPYREMWEEAHREHAAALARSEADRDDMVLLRVAVRLAAWKYELYLESVDVRVGRDVLGRVMPAARMGCE